MPSTSNVLDEALELVKKRLAELDEERKRLERALAELGGTVTPPSPARSGSPRGSGRIQSRAPKAASSTRPPKNAVAVAAAPAPTRPST